MAKRKPAGPWPKLSDTLPVARPGHCQQCGAVGGLTWQECGENDRPTGVAVLLCPDCSAETVAAHPRLYVLGDPLLPGAMAQCDACTFRSGLSCWHPKRARVGLVITPETCSGRAVPMAKMLPFKKGLFD